jgi:hypothetical protein
MINLSDPNINFILFSPEKIENTQEENKVNCERACSILYSKDYTLLSVDGIFEGNKEQSYLCFPNGIDNDKLREDALYLMKYFNQESVLVKYNGDTKVNKINETGDEIPMTHSIYNGDENNKTYLFDGVTYSFIEEKRYYFPSSKNELKNGMRIEYFNNKDWEDKVIENVNKEYEELYKLLMKYNKVRIKY